MARNKKALFKALNDITQELQDLKRKTDPKYILQTEKQLKTARERIKTVEDMLMGAEKVKEHDNLTLSNFIKTCDSLDLSNRRLRGENTKLRTLLLEQGVGTDGKPEFNRKTEEDPKSK